MAYAWNAPKKTTTGTIGTLSWKVKKAAAGFSFQITKEGVVVNEGTCGTKEQAVNRAKRIANTMACEAART